MRLCISAFLCFNIVVRVEPDSGDVQCMTAIQGKDWTPIRVQFMFNNKDSDSHRTMNLRKIVLPALFDYLMSALSIRDQSDEVYYRRRCLYYQFGLCVVEDLSDKFCGKFQIPDSSLGALSIYECPQGSTKAEDCFITRQYPAGNDPFSGGDLFILVTTDLSPSCQVGPSGDPKIKAYMSACSSSACGRPNMAMMNICDINMTDEDLTQLLLHELVHILGFTVGGGMYGWIDSSGMMQISREKQFSLILERVTESDGSVHVKVFKSIPAVGTSERDIRILTIPYHVVKSMDARGFGKSSTCACPVDPTSSFTESQRTKCLLQNGLKDCVFVINTPNVVKYAKSYYNCDSLEGMELENQKNHDGNPNLPWAMFNSHWKYKNIQGELMTAIFNKGVPLFVSPMTLGLLEDSGWYQVNNKVAGTSLIEGVMFGYHSGCGLLINKCFENGEAKVNIPQFPNAFKLPDGDIEHSICSPDGLYVQLHTQNWNVQPTDVVPEQYQYGTLTSNGHRLMDYCPGFINHVSCALVGAQLEGTTNPRYDYSHRCIEVETEMDNGEIQRRGMCYGLRCIDRTSFEVYAHDSEWILNGLCSVQDRVLNDEDRHWILFCPDPELLCAQLNYPHILSSTINSVPNLVVSTR